MTCDYTGQSAFRSTHTPTHFAAAITNPAIFPSTIHRARSVGPATFDSQQQSHLKRQKTGLVSGMYNLPCKDLYTPHSPALYGATRLQHPHSAHCFPTDTGSSTLKPYRCRNTHTLPFFLTSQSASKEARIRSLEAMVVPRPMSRERLPPMEGFSSSHD